MFSISSSNFNSFSCIPVRISTINMYSCATTKRRCLSSSLPEYLQKSLPPIISSSAVPLSLKVLKLLQSQTSRSESKEAVSMYLLFSSKENSQISTESVCGLACCRHLPDLSAYRNVWPEYVPISTKGSASLDFLGSMPTHVMVQFSMGSSSG